MAQHPKEQLYVNQMSSLQACKRTFYEKRDTSSTPKCKRNYHQYTINEYTTQKEIDIIPRRHTWNDVLSFRT